MLKMETPARRELVERHAQMLREREELKQSQDEEWTRWVRKEIIEKLPYQTGMVYLFPDKKRYRRLLLCRVKFFVQTYEGWDQKIFTLRGGGWWLNKNGDPVKWDGQLEVNDEGVHSGPYRGLPDKDQSHGELPKDPKSK